MFVFENLEVKFQGLKLTRISRDIFEVALVDSYGKILAKNNQQLRLNVDDSFTVEGMEMKATLKGHF